MSSRLGYALSQGVAAAAGSASGMLGEQIKAEQKEAADVRMANRQLDNTLRLEAARERLNEQAEVRKQQRAAGRAKEINERAEGYLVEDRSAAEQKRLAELAEQDDALSQNEVAGLSDGGRARYGLPASKASDTERARARLRASEELGYLDEARDARGRLDAERRFTADKDRGERDDRRLDITEKAQQEAARRADATQRFLIARQEAADKQATERARLAAEAEARKQATAAMNAAQAELKVKQKLLEFTTDPKEIEVMKGEIAELSAMLKSGRDGLFGMAKDQMLAPHAKPAGPVDVDSYLNTFKFKSAEPAKTVPAVTPAQPAAATRPERGPTLTPETEKVGLELDAARKDLASIRAQRPPGLLEGREAIDSYNAKLQVARDAVRNAQMRYEKLVADSIGSGRGVLFSAPNNRGAERPPLSSFRLDQ